MATGQPLFPGSSHIDQLQLLIDCFGTLPSLLMSACGDMLRKQLLSVPDQGDAGGLQARCVTHPRRLTQQRAPPRIPPLTPGYPFPAPPLPQPCCTLRARG